LSARFLLNDKKKCLRNCGEAAKVQLSKIIPQAAKNLFPAPDDQRNILIYKY
jgi:hypothetical protein